MASVNFTVEPSTALRGRLRVPGDKSISHRAIILGSLAEGITRIDGFLQGEDCLATLQAFRAMGVTVQLTETGQLIVQGVGVHGLNAPKEPLYLGNSGTSMRLLCGLLAGQSFDTVLTGDASLNRRPMRRIIAPLTQMGACIDSSAAGTAPLHSHGGQILTSIDYTMPIASAQVKSCLLLAGLYARGKTCITEPAPSRDHTERMLESFSYPVQRQGTQVCLKGGGQLHACTIDIPADLSSAAFFLVGASIAPNSDLLLEHVGINPTRIGIITILNRMGARLDILNERQIGGEPVADIRIRSAPLRGIKIPEELVPLAIDEFPAVFIAAACAEGKTVLTGAEELRYKESDRIQVMTDGLRTLGVQIQPTPDGMIIQGGALSGGKIISHGDHRIAMAFAMAALRAPQAIHITDCANVNTSFPNFVNLARSVGIMIRQFNTL